MNIQQSKAVAEALSKIHKMALGEKAYSASFTAYKVQKDEEILFAIETESSGRGRKRKATGTVDELFRKLGLSGKPTHAQKAEAELSGEFTYNDVKYTLNESFEWNLPTAAEAPKKEPKPLNYNEGLGKLRQLLAKEVECGDSEIEIS